MTSQAALLLDITTSGRGLGGETPPLVGNREAAEARALHLIGELVGSYPAGITDPDVAGQGLPRACTPPRLS